MPGLLPGIELAFGVVGSEQAQHTMLVLHGLTESAAMTADLVDGLARDGARVITLDLRGHGRSGHARRYRHSDYAADVAMVVERVTSKPVAVFGHSLGGVVAVSLAQSRPELVSGLVLGDPPLYEGDPAVRAQGHASRQHPERVAQIRRWQTAGVPRQQVVAELSGRPSPHEGLSLGQLLPAADLDAWTDALLACDPAALDASITGDLWFDFDPDALHCPAYVLQADPACGAVLRPEHARRLVEASPTARVVRVPGVSHWLYLEPDGHAETLRRMREIATALGPARRG